MDKNCGTCKWWDRDGYVLAKDGKKSAPCTFPVPFWADINRIYPYENKGQDCSVYLEKKE